MHIGDRISKLRLSKKLSQEELAKKLFVSSKTISSWETNRTEPSLEIIVKLSEILDCSVIYLIYGDIKKNDIETEIKIKITRDKYESLKQFMQINAKFINTNRQIDKYYQPTYRKFINDDKFINEWLRIGIRGNKKILNYKNWYNNMYCDEYEVEIDDEINLIKIFKALGLEEIAIVDKVRTTYLYLNKYEVALDFVNDLGYFIEIEVKKYDDDAAKEYDNLLKLAQKLDLNLNNIDKKGYPYHIIFK